MIFIRTNEAEHLRQVLENARKKLSAKLCHHVRQGEWGHFWGEKGHFSHFCPRQNVVLKGTIKQAPYGYPDGWLYVCIYMCVSVCAKNVNPVHNWLLYPHTFMDFHGTYT